MKILKKLLKKNLKKKEEIQYESKPIRITDAMGREKFWEDIGRPND